MAYTKSKTIAAMTLAGVFQMGCAPEAAAPEQASAPVRAICENRNPHVDPTDAVTTRARFQMNAESVSVGSSQGQAFNIEAKSCVFTAAAQTTMTVSCTKNGKPVIVIDDKGTLAETVLATQISASATPQDKPDGFASSIVIQGFKPVAPSNGVICIIGRK